MKYTTLYSKIKNLDIKIYYKGIVFNIFLFYQNENSQKYIYC